jgi:hypothetical protein
MLIPSISCTSSKLIILVVELRAVKIYVAAVEALRKKRKTGWNSVYHQNWWFSEFHPWLNLILWMTKLRVLVLCFSLLLGVTLIWNHNFFKWSFFSLNLILLKNNNWDKVLSAQGYNCWFHWRLVEYNGGSWNLVHSSRNDTGSALNFLCNDSPLKPDFPWPAMVDLLKNSTKSQKIKLSAGGAARRKNSGSFFSNVK